MPMTFLGPAPQSCWDELRALATDLHAAAIATSPASRATDIPAEYGLGSPVHSGIKSTRTADCNISAGDCLRQNVSAAHSRIFFA